MRTAILSLLALALTTTAQQCYYPAGNPSNDVPCSSSGGTCCSSKDRCLSNGLCRIDDTASDKAIQFARGSCTDSAWGSSCFQQCSKLSRPGSPWTNTASVFICNSTVSNPSGASYCCETSIGQGQGCCTSDTFWLAAGSSPASPPPPSSSAAAPPKPSNHVLIQQASSSSSVSIAAVTTVTSAEQTHATIYSTSSVSYAVNSTSVARATGSVSGRLSSATGLATGSPIGPVGPTATGGAGRVGQAGLGLLVAAGMAVALL